MDPLYLLIVVLSYIVLNAICAVVIFLLWLRIHERFSGTGFWLAAYLLQFCSVVLVFLREAIPEPVSVIVGNGLLISSTIILLIGLERFVGKPGPQWHNVLLFAVFLTVHSYFYFSHPLLAARNINISIALILICGQCAWLTLHRLDAEMRFFTRGAGLVFLGICVASLIRIGVDLVFPTGENLIHSTNADTVVLVAYQMLFIALTFTLSLMVNLRLFADLERDITIRKRVEGALRESEEKFSKAFHSSPDAVLISRVSDGKLLEVNDGFCRLSGYTRKEALNRTVDQLHLWKTMEDRNALLAELREGRPIQNREIDFCDRSGKVFHCLFSGEITELAGEPHLVSIVRDITDRKHAEEDLRRSEADFRGVFENSAQGLFILDVLEDGKFRIHESNPMQARTSGIPRSQLDGKLLEEIFPAEMAELMRASCLRCLAKGTPISMEEQLDFPSGIKHVLTTLAPVRDETGRICRIIGSTLDISERKWAEEILRLRLNLWEYAVGHSVDELMQRALDEIEAITESQISFYHFVMEDQVTLSLQAWSTRTRREFCHAEGQGMHYDLEQAGVWADCIRLRKPIIHNDYASLTGRKGMPDGHAKVLRELVVPTFHGERMVAVLGIGNKSCPYDEYDAELLSSIADIVWVIVDHKRTEEEIHNLQAKLAEMAVHDSLTGLFNRHYLNATLKRELALAAREKYPVSFVMIDIDRFKEVNDTFGHIAGDAVLQNTASLLLSNCRASDIIFRYGGEEFLAVLPRVKVELAFQIAEKWRKNFLKTTTLLGYGGVKATISCGISAFPKHGTDGEELIALADQAMYQAKSAGRNRSMIWKESKKKTVRPRGKTKKKS